MLQQTTGSATSPAGTPPGANADRAALSDPRSVLAAMEEARSAPAANVTEAEPPSSPADDPENPTPPAGTGEPGQENLPPDETSEAADAADDTPPEGGETLPESSDNELTEVLNGLDDTQRNQLLGMLKDVNEGKTSWNDLKKGHRLKSEHERKLAELQQKLEQLTADKEIEAQAARGDARPSGNMPEAVGKLKTVDEVQARLDKANGYVESLTDILDANPGDAATVIDLESGQIVQAEADGKRYATRAQIIAARANWRAEARALPQRAQQLERQAQFQQQQQQARAQALKDFAWLSDAEHPDSKRIPKLLEEVPALKQSIMPEYFAGAFLRGTDALTAELEARAQGKSKEFDAAMKLIRGLAAVRAARATGPANGNGHTARPITLKPAGKVPLGKPHSGGGSGVTRTRTVDGVKSAIQRVNQEGSRDAMAALLSATGR